MDKFPDNLIDSKAQQNYLHIQYNIKVMYNHTSALMAKGRRL